MITITMSIICDECGKRTEIDVEPEEKRADCGCCSSDVVEITLSRIWHLLPPGWTRPYGTSLRCSACDPVR